MKLSSLFRSDSKLSTREQALINYSVFAALKNEEGLQRIRERASELDLSPALMEQVDQTVEAARAVDLQSMDLDEALAQAASSACCQG